MDRDVEQVETDIKEHPWKKPQECFDRDGEQVETDIRSTAGKGPKNSWTGMLNR